MKFLHIIIPFGYPYVCEFGRCVRGFSHLFAALETPMLSLILPAVGPEKVRSLLEQVEKLKVSLDTADVTDDEATYLRRASLLASSREIEPEPPIRGARSSSQNCQTCIHCQTLRNDCCTGLIRRCQVSL